MPQEPQLDDDLVGAYQLFQDPAARSLVLNLQNNRILNKILRAVEASQLQVTFSQPEPK